MTRLFRGWLVHPPTHRLVAGYLGYKPPYRDDDVLDDPQAETERWLKIEEECAKQELGEFLGLAGNVIRVTDG